MKKLSPLLILLLFLNGVLNAQNWQWARAGGGVVDSPLTQGPWRSFAYDMTIDKWGSVYTCGLAYDNLQFTGTTQTFPYYGTADAYIVKYDKCGNFVWCLINAGPSEQNYAIASDSVGNIYVNVIGYADAQNPIHIHTSLTHDSLVTSGGNFLMKYDPNGNLIWMQPTPGCTATHHCLKIRNDGKLVGIFDYPQQGGTWQSFTVKPVRSPAYSVALILFDPQSGNVLKGALLDTVPYGNSGVMYMDGFTLDENDNMYLPLIPQALMANGPYPNASFLGQVFTIPIYAATLLKINKNFSLVNYQFDDNSEVIDHVIYSEGALFAGGLEFPYSNYVTDTVGALNNIGEYRMYRLDTATLAPVWASSPTIYTGSAAETFVTATSKHVYMITGYTGELVWGADTFALPYKQVMFDLDKSTGHFDKYIIDSGGNTNVTLSMITADSQENLLINGQFSGTFTCGPNTLTPWGGSQSPIFFIEKWGIDCSDSINTADNPYPPLGLVTTATGQHSIQGQWGDNSQYRISFHVYRSPNGINGWQRVDTTIGSVLTISDTGLTPNTWYWYKVTAWNMTGESDFSNIDSAKTFGPICIATTDSLNRTVCSGDTVYIGSHAHYTAGTTIDTLTNANGCDSIVTLFLTITQPLRSAYSHTICAGAIYNFNGRNLTSGGTYADTLTAVSTGCDSIVTLTLSVTQPLLTSINHTICAGATYNFNGRNLTADGTYLDTLTAVSTGCDSIITLTLSVTQPLLTSINHTICAGATYNFNGTNLTAGGTYADTLTAVSTSCDSIITLTLSVTQPLLNSISGAICPGDTFNFNGRNLTTAGTYRDTLTAASTGCDSIVTLTLTVTNAIASTFTVTSPVCAGQSSTITYTGNAAPNATYAWDFNGGAINSGTGQGPYMVDWGTAGTKNITLTVSTGSCTSTLTTVPVTVNTIPALTITPDTSVCAGGSVSLTVSGANSYVWSPSGSLNSASGSTVIATPDTTTIYMVTGSTSGCSAMDSLQVTVNPTPTSSFTATSPVCVGQNSTITYTGTGTGVSVYAWSFDGGTVNSGSGQGPYTVTWSAGGVANVSLVVTDNGCTSNTTNVPVTVNAPPVVTFSFDSMASTMMAMLQGGDTEFCIGNGENQIPLSGGNPSGGIYSGVGISNNIISINSQGTFGFTYTYTDNNGCSASVNDSLHAEICLDIKQVVDDNNGVIIYPNPATDQLFIKTDGLQPVLITIYDVNGRMIQSMPYRPEADVSHLSAGAYFIEVTGNGIVARKMFVKM